MSTRQRILLHVRESGGVDRQAWPITQGVPFPDKTLPRDAPVRIVNAAGRSLPCQTACLATWDKDQKYVKWMLIDFQVDIKANAAQQFFLEYGQGVTPTAPPAHPVTVENRTDGISIATGMLRLRLRPGSPDFFKACEIKKTADGWHDLWQGRAPTLYMSDQRGNRYESGGVAPAPSIVIEESGPMRAAVCIKGFHVDSRGLRFCPFILRLHLFAGRSDWRCYHTFIFDQDPEKIELAEIGMRFSFNLGLDLKAAIGGEGGTCALDAPDSLALIQTDDRNYTISRGLAVLQRGAKSPGWARLSGRNGSVVAAIRDHWQEYPKGFRLSGDTLDVQVWPKTCGRTLKFTTPFKEPAIFFNKTRDEETVKRLLAERPTAPLNLKSFNVRTYEDLLWVEKIVKQYASGRIVSYNDTGTDNGVGAAKTTEIYVGFSENPVNDVTTKELVRAAQEPLIAPPDPAYTCATKAVGHFYHAGDPVFSEIDSGLNDILNSVAIEPVERCRLYGMMRYGNMVCSHAPGPALAYVHYKDTEPEKALRYVGPYNNEANDQIGAAWGNFVRTGRRDHFLLAQRYSSNVADVGFIHARPADPSAVGLMHYHNGHQWSGSGSPSHALVRGLLLDYFFTGNRRFLEVAREAGDWVLRHQEPCGIVSCRDGALHREFTGPLWNLMELYQATWEEKYGDVARRSLNWFLRTLPEPGNYPVSVYTRGERGDEAVVEPPGGRLKHAREHYYLFEAALRLFDSQPLREHILAETNRLVWDDLTDGYLTAEMARKTQEAGALFWQVDEQFYWTPAWGCFPLWVTGMVCLAYDLTNDMIYAAYAKDQLEGTFLRHARRIRRFADFSFSHLYFGSFIPRLMRIVADARNKDPVGLDRAYGEWLKKREELGMPIYTGPGVDMDKDQMDSNGNIVNRAPVDLPREGPERKREPVVSLGRLSTADHPAP